VRPPLLLVDVDGVISLFGFDAREPPPGQFLLVDGIPHYLSTEAGALVTSLADSFELVWCTGWEEKVDLYLPHHLGVPAGLPHLSFGGAGVPATQRHWKLSAIDAFAGDERALAWIDDAFDESCYAWAHARRGPTELIATDPATGLTAEQAAGLGGWAAALAAQGARG
jgi:hypothetical protein